jgi:hypothetical protein
MKYIADADTIIEAVLNRCKTYEQVAKLWSETYTKSSEIFISSIGRDRICSIVKLFADIDEDATQFIKLIDTTFKVIEVDPEILQEARQIDLLHNDFESSIEMVCAAEYELDGIVTDRHDSFLHNNPRSEISSLYEQKVMDITSFCLDIRRHESLIRPQLQSLKLTNPKLKDTAVSRQPQLPIEKTNENKTTADTQKQLKNLAESQPSLTPDEMVDVYTHLAKMYGGEDWGNYQENYKAIADKWNNFEIVLAYCWKRAVLLEAGYYEKFVNLWNLLNRFCDLYGYHEDRIKWLNEVINLSQEREDWFHYLSALTSKAWTLIMLDRLNKPTDCNKSPDCTVYAGDVLNRASKVLDLANDAEQSFRYYHCLSLYYTHISSTDHSKIAEAEAALVQQRYLFGAIQAKGVSKKSLARYKVNHMSDFAKVDYEMGLIKSGSDPDAAKELFAKSEKTMLSCLDLAKSIGWQRGIAYMCNKIANVNLDLARITEDTKEKEALLDRVEIYLKIGEPIATHNECNKRRTGSYLLSFARLESMRIEIGLSKISYTDIPATLGRTKVMLSSPEKKALKAIDLFTDGGNKRKIRQAVKNFPRLNESVIRTGSIATRDLA